MEKQIVPVRPYVILDKNFLKKEDYTTPRLRALALCGCEFVLSDTLIYEVCSDTQLARLWPSLQRKLFPFAGRLHSWFPNSELIRREVAANQPIAGPEDDPATRSLQEWFRSERVYVPTDLKRIVEQAHEQREVASMKKIAPMAQAFGELITSAGRSVGIQKLSKNDLAARISENLADERLIRWALRACYGNSNSAEDYIPDAENRVDQSWFAYHNARVTLVLIGVFLKKYGLSEKPGKKFPNTKLDTDYLALLHYADGLASDETTGDMAEMCEWLYGSTRKLISSDALFAAIPPDHEIRLEAYRTWEFTGRTQGHDMEDWLASESRLYEQMWYQL
jgi:hypothetical protein